MDEIFHRAWGPLSLWLREERAARIIERHRKKRRREMLRGCFEAWVHATTFMPPLLSSDSEPIHEDETSDEEETSDEDETSDAMRFGLALAYRISMDQGTQVR